MYLLDSDILIDIQRGYAPAQSWFQALTEHELREHHIETGHKSMGLKFWVVDFFGALPGWIIVVLFWPVAFIPRLIHAWLKEDDK